MNKGILVAIGGLALLAGCGTQGDKAPTQPAAPKAKAPYHIEFDSKTAKPNPSGITLPAINFTTTPAVQERRVVLVVRFDSSAAMKDHAITDQMIMGPVDVPDTAGTLPANYLDLADAGLAKMLATACMKGTIKVKVALVRSSIKPGAGDAEIDAKRLSDWIPTEVVFKNPHPKC